MHVKRALPSREERDDLLTRVFGHDPRPPSCTTHVDARLHRKGCQVCNIFNRWRIRMTKRFHDRGLRLVLADETYERLNGDPQPTCLEGHTDPMTAAMKLGCDQCRKFNNWRARQYQKLRAAGTPSRLTDIDELRHHVKLLREAGQSCAMIARAAQCGESTVIRLLNDDNVQRFLSAAVAARIQAVPVPERRLVLIPDASGALRYRIDSTGTIRRIQAAVRAGHSLSAQACRYGYAHSTVRGWMADPTISVTAADVVAAHFPTLITRPGADEEAAKAAAGRGWLEARYFAEANIDDPAYDPFKILVRPVGLARRLQALAWDAYGPRQVAEFIGEPIYKVTSWLRGDPAPAYVVHLVDAAYEQLAGTRGPDDQAARRARREKWAPAMAWYDVDIDSRHAKPQIRPPVGSRREPLLSQVWQCLLGIIPATELLSAERRSVVRILHRAGWTDRRIAAWTRWNADGDIDRGADAVCRVRVDNGFTGAYRPEVFTGDNIHIVTPSAA